MEANAEDESGTVLDTTNDLVGQVLPGQKANLTFRTTARHASKFRITQIQCQ